MSKIEITKIAVDHKGRYCICNVKMENSEYTLCNLYGPNLDSPKFYERCFKVLSEVATANVIIGGDFNLVIDVEKDRYKSKINNCQAAKYVKQFMNENCFNDVWHDRNPDSTRYTWFKEKGVAHRNASRIDFFLTKVGLCDIIVNVEITSAHRTDHALITLNIVDDLNPRGPGIWKLNNKLLDNESFCTGLKKTINEHYQNCIRTNLNKREMWDVMKSKCQTFAKKFTKNKSQKDRTLLDNLYKLEYLFQHDKLVASGEDKRREDAMLLVQTKIDELENSKLEGAIFHSRYKW